MSSKKKKKKPRDGLLTYIDESLDSSYDSVMKEVEMYQLQLLEADQKAKKKARKKMKEDPNYFTHSKERIKARKKVVQEMEEGSFFERVEAELKLLKPVVIILSRLVASVIVAILNFTPLQMYLKPETVKKMSNLYQSCMKVGIA